MSYMRIKTMKKALGIFLIALPFIIFCAEYFGFEETGT